MAKVHKLYHLTIGNFFFPGIYLTVTMAMTSLSIILTVGVLHLHHKGPNNTPVPKRLRIVLFDYLAPFLRMSSVERYRLASRDRWAQSKAGCNNQPGRINAMLETTTVSNDDSQSSRAVANAIASDNTVRFLGAGKLTASSRCTVSLERCPQQSTTIQSETETEQKNRNFAETGQYRKLTQERNPSHPNRWSDSHGLSRNRSCSDLNSLSGQVWTDASEMERRALTDDLSRLIWHADQQQAHMDEYLTLIQRNQSVEEHSLDIMNEWRMAALIVDRTLFWLFLTVATLATIVILIVMPLFKPNQLTRWVQAPRSQPQPFWIIHWTFV